MKKIKSFFITAFRIALGLSYLLGIVFLLWKGMFMELIFIVIILRIWDAFTSTIPRGGGGDVYESHVDDNDEEPQYYWNGYRAN